jgi:hypothetical protein
VGGILAASVPYRKEGAMPRKTIKITGEERDALYDQVRNHLAALGDVFVAMECQKDYATAERLGIEFGEDFRLLQDLGWPEDDDRDRVELTMPYEDLTELMRRLREEAQGGLVDARKEREAVAGANVIEGLESTILACSEVMEAIELQERGPQAQRT